MKSIANDTSLMDHLQVYDKDKIYKLINVNFSQKITRENWCEMINLCYTIDIYKKYIISYVEFFIQHFCITADDSWKKMNLVPQVREKLEPLYESVQNGNAYQIILLLILQIFKAYL